MHTRIGIQGGHGSFNEEAFLSRITESGLSVADFEIHYLFTTWNVLEALLERRVERGHFATINTLGGRVRETEEAKRHFHFDKCCVSQGLFRLKISHCLLAFPGVGPNELDTVLTHPQVIAQCRGSFAQRFPSLKLVAGTGDLQDPARVAESIMKGELPRTTATASASRIASAFGLEILARDLQDDDENYTYFELAARREP